MVQKVLFTALSALLILTGTSAQAQIDSSHKIHKVLVFTPLYLDSAFDKITGEYKYGKQFPHFINPGLEFYEGVQLALDSLAEEKAHALPAKMSIPVTVCILPVVLMIAVIPIIVKMTNGQFH